MIYILNNNENNLKDNIADDLENENKSDTYSITSHESIDESILKDDEFLNAIFNAKQDYFLKDVKFNSKYSDFGAFEQDENIYFASARDEGVSTKNLYSWNEEQ